MFFRQFRNLEPGEFIVVGADTAMGLNDYCAAQFLSPRNNDVPMVYHSRTSATDMTNRLFEVLEKIYDVTGVAPVVAYERNNGGVFELERLASLNRLNKFRIYVAKNVGNLDNATGSKIGWDTNTATRPMMLAEIKEAIDKQLITIYDKATLTEMFSFILAQTSSTVKAQAEKGAHDDLIMSLAIAWQLRQTEVARSSQDLERVVHRNASNAKKWQLR